MKYLLYILLIPLLFFASCAKVMDTNPLNSYTGEDVWGNYGLAQGYLFNCYANNLNGYIFSWDYDAITKSVKTQVWGGSYVAEKTEQIDRNSDEGWNPQGHFFSRVRAVNLALQKLPSSPFTTVQKNTLIGEAYFLRAAIYSNSVFKFGGVQIVKDVLDVNSNFGIPRSSLKDSYDFVLSDLDSAAILLPATNDRGRATQGAAYALKMRVGLQAGAYLNDNSYYTAVKATGDKLFALGKYSLDSYSNLFNQYAAAVVSPENILIYERRSTNTQFQNTPMQALVPNVDNVPSKMTAAALQKYPLTESFEGWQTYSPTQDLVDDYLVTDADGVERRWDQTSYVTSGHTVNEKIFQHRDKRFYATIVYDSTKFFNNLIYTRTDGNASTSITPLDGGVIANGGGTASETGYLFQKYVYQAKKLWYSDPTDFCYSVLRLGEAYLNYAEAAIKLGDEATARTYITKTYQAHGGFTNEITSSGEELWSDYKRERNIEMILETGDRYWSLLRWGMQQAGGLQEGYSSSAPAIAELNGKPHGLAISADGKSYQVYETTDNNGLPLKFTPRRYLFPVPQSEITSLPILTQNEGW